MGPHLSLIQIVLQNPNSVVAAGGSSVTGSINGGAGGSLANSNGTPEFVGGNGGSGGATSNDGGGGGGSSASATGGGVNGSNGSGSTGGNGGDGLDGDGGRGSDDDNTPPASAGTAPGGGGGGRGDNGGTSQPGAAGQIFISWSCPTYNLSGISSTAICSGNLSIITLNASATDLPVGSYNLSYTLSGANTGTVNNVPFVVTVAGTAVFTTGVLNNSGATTIAINSISAGGCTSTITGISTNITVNPTPSMTAGTAADGICFNAATQTSLNYTNSSDGDSYSINWDAIAEGANLLDQPLTPHTFSGPGSISDIALPPGLAIGTYNGTITIANANCTFSQAISVTVNPSLTPAVTISGPTSLCTGTNAVFTATATGTDAATVTYTFLRGGSEVLQTGTSATYSALGSAFSAGNVITVNISLTGGTGCFTSPTASSSNDVTILEVNTTPTSTNETAAVCSGATYELDLTSKITNAVPSNFSWIAADNPNVSGESTTTQTTSSISNTLINSTNSPHVVVYTVTPTSVTGSCAGAPFTVTVTVNPVPVANFNPAAPLTITTGTVVNFTDLSTGGITSWSWSFPGGSPSSSTSTNQSVTYNVPGTYDVVLTVTNPNCGSDVETRTGFVTVEALTSPRTFTSNGTLIVPPGVTCVRVEAIGAGGGGASASDFGTILGGGGGGGAYARSHITVAPLGSYPIGVGIGGAANTTGGSSTFDGTAVVAAGGSGATNNSATGAAGGSTGNSTGDVEFAGGTGGTGGGGLSGGGGGGAGSTGAGGNASGGTAGTGTSVGGGNGAIGENTDDDGNNGSIYGGGGSGAAVSFATRTGGSGANGRVIVSWIDVSNFSLSTLVPSICQNQDGIGTITSSTLGNGVYIVNYSLSGANTTPVPVNATLNFNASTGTFTIPKESLFNPGTTTVTVNSIAFEDGGCPQTPVNNITIITIQNAIPVLSSTAGTDAQTVCINTPISMILRMI